MAGRLQALSRSHDVLTAEAWASAALADIVQGALEPVREQYGERITAEGPELRLKPRIATMLSLGMHELASNARRYGSLSNGTGNVRIRWRIEGDRRRFEWRERGGPPVREPATGGYGMRIVERVLAAEFGGSARIDFEPDGIVFRLDAPTGDLGREATAWSMV